MICVEGKKDGKLILDDLDVGATISEDLETTMVLQMKQRKKRTMMRRNFHPVELPVIPPWLPPLFQESETLPLLWSPPTSLSANNNNHTTLHHLLIVSVVVQHLADAKINLPLRSLARIDAVPQAGCNPTSISMRTGAVHRPKLVELHRFVDQFEVGWIEYSTFSRQVSGTL